MAEEVKEEVKKKGGNVLLIAVIGILVFLLIIGGLVAFIMLGSSDENAAARQPQATTQGPAPSPKQRSNDFFNIGPMDQFLVNLLSESGSRFLKTALNLELSEETLAPEIDKKKPLIRDIIIRTLSSKTYEDVSTAKGKERLKDELVTKINETLRDGYIKNVYFTDFIVQ
ncbi:MAG: flagellar basal body-associated protein FliL [Campylobacter hyointestinalis]